MYALTLHRPWPFAIFASSAGRKNIENRAWRPPARVIGRRIAIHAGRQFDMTAVGPINRAFGELVCPSIVDPGGPVAHRTGIIGTVVLVGWIDVRADEAGVGGEGLRADPEAVERALRSPWFVGPCGWVLADPVMLDAPIPCRGQQGLWAVAPEHQAVIDAGCSKLGEHAGQIERVGS